MFLGVHLDDAITLRWCNAREPKAVHYMIESVIASSECTTLKHVVPGKHVLNVLFLVTLTFNQADALKLTGLLVHMVLKCFFHMVLKHFSFVASSSMEISHSHCTILIKEKQ